MYIKTFAKGRENSGLHCCRSRVTKYSVGRDCNCKNVRIKKRNEQFELFLQYEIDVYDDYIAFVVKTLYWSPCYLYLAGLHV